MRYLEAVEAMDEVAIAACFVRDQREAMLFISREVYSDTDNIVISDLETTVVLESPAAATVLAEYDWEMTIAGAIQSAHVRQMLDLTEVDGQWLITGIKGVPDYSILEAASRRFATYDEVMWLATATFFSDPHRGFNVERNTWCDSMVDAAGHYYPTAIGEAAGHTLVLNHDEVDPLGNPRVDDGSLGTPADTATIERHAVWMGLLVHDAASFTPVPGGTKDRGAAAPLAGDGANYLAEPLDSAGVFNGMEAPGGLYSWVIGADGASFAAYSRAGGTWYSGFIGLCP